MRAIIDMLGLRISRPAEVEQPVWDSVSSWVRAHVNALPLHLDLRIRNAVRRKL